MYVNELGFFFFLGGGGEVSYWFICLSFYASNIKHFNILCSSVEFYIFQKYMAIHSNRKIVQLQAHKIKPVKHNFTLLVQNMMFIFYVPQPQGYKQ